MKAVVTFDLDEMPKNCGDCLLVMDFKETHCIACMGINDTVPNNANDGIIGSYLDPEKFPDSEIEEIYERKPDWCPLRELPSKMRTDGKGVIRAFVEGYNTCLDAIEGTEKEE